MWTMAECPQLLAQNLNLGELCSSGGQNLLVIHHSEAILDPLGPHYFVDYNGQGVLQAEALCLVTVMPHVCGT